MVRGRMSGGSALSLAAGAALSVGSAASAGVPIDAFWLNPVNGSWGAAANWDVNQVPNNNGTDEYNAFLRVGGSAYQVDLDLDVTVNNLTIDAPLGAATLRLNAFDFTVRNQLLVENNCTIEGAGLGEFSTLAGSTTTFNGARLMNITRLNASGNVIYAGAGDEICDTDIDHGGDAEVTTTSNLVLQGSTQFRTLSTGTLALTSNGTITTTMGTPTIVNQGTIVRRSMLRGPAAFTIEGVNVLNETTGTISVEAGSLQITGPGGRLDNQGTLQIDAARTLEVAAGATLANFNQGSRTLSGGTYAISGALRFDTGGMGIEAIDADVTLDGVGSEIQNADTSSALANTSSLTAAGRFTLQGGRSFTTGGSFANQGTVTIDNGSTFEVPVGSTLNGYDAGGTRTLTGGTFVIRDTAAPGDAVLQFDAGAAGIDTIDATLVLDGDNAFVRSGGGLNALANTDTLGPSGRLELRGGKDITTGGSFTVASTGSLVVDNGSVFEVPVGAGNSLTNFASGVLSDGAFDVRGTLRAPNLAVNTIGVVANPVNVVLDGVGSRFEDSAGADAFGVLNLIETGSSLTLRNGRSLSITGTLTVRGTLRIEGGAPLLGSERGSGPLSTVSVTADYIHESGGMELRGGVIQAGGMYDLMSGSLEGFGTIDLVTLPPPSMTSGTTNLFKGSGTVSPGLDLPGLMKGRLTIDGDFEGDEDSHFVFDLGGLAPGVSYDQLVVTGSMLFADTDGDDDLPTVQIRLCDGFVPMLGDRFEIVRFGSLDGESMLEFDGLELRPGLALRVEIDADSIDLIAVVPAPGGALLALAGLMSATRRRRSCREG